MISSKVNLFIVAFAIALMPFIDCGKDQNMTPLQKAKRDYWVYQKAFLEDWNSQKRGESTLHESHKLKEKYLGITPALNSLLLEIYRTEYKNKFGETVGIGISEPPLLIAYLRICYTFPHKTEAEWVELYREAIRAGVVRAMIDGKCWKWNPEDDKLKSKAVKF